MQDQQVYQGRLKELLVTSGLKQRFVARQCGMSEHRLSRLVNGYEAPRTKEMRAIAAFFNKEIEEVWVMTRQ